MLTSSPFSVVSRGVSRGVLTLLRENHWMSALGALLGVFLLVQLLTFVLLGLAGVQELLQNRTDLRLEVRTEASEQDVQEFFSALNQLSYVEETVFITKEKAYEQTKQTDPELIAFLEEFNLQNPFADTIGVTLVSLEEYDAFAEFVSTARWQSVVNPAFLSQVTDQEDHISALMRVTQAGRSLTMIILIITAFALMCITMELTRHRAVLRANEVLVERLVGASPLSILLPFWTEAALLFFSAIMLSAALLGAFIFALPELVPALQEQGVLANLQQTVQPLLLQQLPLLLAAQLIVTPIIAGAGAWLGIRPHIHSPQIALVH